MRTFRRAIIAAAAAVGLFVLATAGPAAADSEAWSLTNNAKASWNRSADLFTVCDREPDGLGARSTLWISWDGVTYSVYDTYVDANGSGNACFTKYLSFLPQGYWIRYRACDRYNGEPLIGTCGAWAYDQT